MIKILLALVLSTITGVVFWSGFEKAQWPVDFTTYEALNISFGPVDLSYKESINPELFEGARVIKNFEKLVYPQHIVVDNQGIIYSGLQDGRLVSIDLSDNITQLYHHQNAGMILGLALASDESTLYYVTQLQGLIMFDLSSKKPTILLKQFQGKPIPALNSLCIDEEHQILYMTDSAPYSLRFATKESLLKHKRGRILSYDLKSNKTTLVFDNLASPNGIVYDKESKSIIFAELTHYKVSKIRVEKGQAAGKPEKVIDNLFGYPDNLKLDSSGNLYVGIPVARDPKVEFLNERPDIRTKMLYLPQNALGLFIPKIAGGIVVDVKQGRIKKYVFGDTSTIYFVSTFFEQKGKMYFSSLINPTIVVVDSNNTTKPVIEQL